MEPSVLPEYSVRRHFVLYDAIAYAQFGGQAALFRSLGSMHYEDDDPAPQASIDLVLLGLMYLEMPVGLKGIRLFKPRDQKALRLAQEFDTHNPDDPSGRVYAVASEGKHFYFVSANCWIHEHRKRMSESSLSLLCTLDLPKRDAYFAEYVKNWYKID